MRFRKRGDDAPPIPVHNNQAMPTAAELRQRLLAINEELAILARQRTESSLPALAGHESAKSTIIACDAKMKQLTAEQETLKSGLSQLRDLSQGQQAQTQEEQIKAGYLHAKPRHVKMLRPNIQTNYDQLALALSDANYQLADALYNGGWVNGNRYTGLAAIPRDEAAKLTSEEYWRRQHEQGAAMKINKESLERIKVKLDATIWCTDDLLASVEPPPLSEYLKDFPERLNSLRERERQGTGALTGLPGIVTITNIPRK